jgi:hypothetical protein
LGPPAFAFAFFFEPKTRGAVFFASATRSAVKRSVSTFNASAVKRSISTFKALSRFVFAALDDLDDLDSEAAR